MNDNNHHDHPYQQFANTPQWAVLDRAVVALVENEDLQETTAHEYVVGYLCQALANGLNGKDDERGASMDLSSLSEAPKRRSREEIKAILQAARETVKAANPTNRDILAEFLAERRAAAADE